YLIVGLNAKDNGVGTTETMQQMLTQLNEMFSWHILLLVPAIIVLAGSIMKKPTLPTIIFSSIVAAFISIFYQGYSMKNVFASTVVGFNVEMVEKVGFNHEAVIPEVIRLVTQGGMQSMTSVILIAFSAFAFAGIITKAGALEVIMDGLLKIVRRTGDLILSTVLSCITMALVTGNSYLSIFVPSDMFIYTYIYYKLHP